MHPSLLFGKSRLLFVVSEIVQFVLPSRICRSNFHGRARLLGHTVQCNGRAVRQMQPAVWYSVEASSLKAH